MITTVTLNPALDKTIYISKLQPNDTNRILRVEVDAGGKGINCSRMLKRLGVDSRTVAFLGGDPGDYIRMVLDKEDIPLEAISTGRPTRTCIAVEESGDTPPTTLNEAGGPIEHRELVEFLEAVKNAARESSFIVFGGSIPAGVNPDIYKALIEIGNTLKTKSVLDADGEPLAIGLKAKPFMIKPNRDELERLLGVEMTSKGDVARAAMKIADDKSIPLVVVSLGKQGAIACYGGEVYSAIPPEVKSISTIGSGDSMIAGILTALDSGADIQDALRLGCAAGAATAMSSGADIGRKEDVDNLLSKTEVSRIQVTQVNI